MVTAFVAGCFLAVTVGWPNDWARRRAPRLVRDLTTLINVAGLTLGIALLASYLQGGIGTVLGLVLGALIGSAIGDRLAELRFGSVAVTRR